MHVWILAYLSRLVPGGMRRHMELHAEGLERLGHRATLLFAEDFAEQAPAWLSTRLTGLRSYVALRERFRAEAPDVVNVHTHCAPAWIGARHLERLSARIVVMSYAADEPQVSVRNGRDVLRWVRAALPARATFPRADGVWCVNQQDVHYYAGAYGVPRARLVRLPHGVHDSFYAAPSGARRDPKRLLFVGTWITRKGIDVLASALDRVVERRPDVSIVLAGTLTSEAAVRTLLSRRLNEHVTVVNQASDAELAKLYQTSALLLLPSRREGLPIVMLEAMACGCPTLAAANSGMLDAIEPGVNGWLEATFDPARWATRILELVADEAALDRASRGARESAETYRIERVARSAVAWYRTLR